MAKSTKTASSATPECTCGPFKPQAHDHQIDRRTSAQEVLSMVMLLCDDDTGVFFFRYDQKLYLRVIERG
jgi:hypothetical protein